MSTETWQQGEKLNTAVTNFHQLHARQPVTKLEEARAVHHQIMSEIFSYLRSKNICSRIEYTGSSYEGVKVACSVDDPDIEFDVMVILTHGSRLAEHPVSDEDFGYAILKPRQGFEQSVDLQGMLSYKGVMGFMTSDTYVDAGKLRNVFMGEITKWKDRSQTAKNKIQLREHGPAVQLDMHPDPGVLSWGKKLYSVDIVPAFEVNGKLYVAKPSKHAEMPQYAWRQSFSLKEKEKLDAADRGNGCRKQVFRVLKVIRNREAGLTLLTSYHLKTALFRVMDTEVSWTYKDLGRRLIDVMHELENSLSSGFMSHYYLAYVNLLQGMNAGTRLNMRDRIRKLRTNENQLMAVLNF